MACKQTGEGCDAPWPSNTVPCLRPPCCTDTLSLPCSPPVAARDAKLAAVDRPARERSEVLVNKPEDVAFVRQLVEQVEAWRQVGAIALLGWWWWRGGFAFAAAAAAAAAVWSELN